MRATLDKLRGGRPPKFEEASRPVTVTLPERILQALAAIGPDRAKAIVKCVESVSGGEDGAKPVDLIEVLPGKALIVVGPSRFLQRSEWLRLAEIAPGRYLLILPPGTPVEVLELEIQDALEKLEPGEEDERRTLSELRGLLAQHRQRRAVSKAELVFVDLPLKS